MPATGPPCRSNALILFFTCELRATTTSDSRGGRRGAACSPLPLPHSSGGCCWRKKSAAGFGVRGSGVEGREGKAGGPLRSGQARDWQRRRAGTGRRSPARATPAAAAAAQQQRRPLPWRTCAPWAHCAAFAPSRGQPHHSWQARAVAALQAPPNLTARSAGGAPTCRNEAIIFLFPIHAAPERRKAQAAKCAKAGAAV